MTKKQQEATGIPQDVLMQYWNEWNPLDKSYQDGLEVQVGVKKYLDAGMAPTARKLAESHLGKNKGSFKDTNEWTGGAGQIKSKGDPAKVDNSLPTVTLPDQAAIDKAAATATAKGKGSGTGSSKGSAAAKQAASALGIKPIMDPERSVEEDLATLPESQGGTLPNKMAVANEGQDEMPENLKPDKFVIDAADILSMGQVLTGIMSSNKERPLDKVNPIFAIRVDAAISNA